jgi:TonB family protein
MANIKQTYQLFNPSGCLTLEAMQLYLKKELPERDIQQIDSHLKKCEFCSDALEGLKLFEDKEKLEAIVGEINENLTRSLAEKSNEKKQKVIKFQNRLIYFGAAASIIILLGLLYFLTDLINQENRTHVSQQVNTEKQTVPPMPRAKNQVVREVKSDKKELEETESKAPASEVFEVDDDVENEKPTGKQEAIRTQGSDKGVSPMKIRKNEESFGDRLLVEEILQDEEEKDLTEKGEVLLASAQPIEYYLGEVFIYDETIEFPENMDMIQRDFRGGGITKSNATRESRANVLGNAMKGEKQSKVPEVLPKQPKKSKAEEPGDQHFFLLVDRLPEFPGGEQGLVEYLNANLKYPLEAKKNHIQGTVLVSFVVEKDGSISGTRVLHGIGGGCDEAALETINNMPRWNPAIKEGKNVRVLFNLPITFVLR